MIQDEQHLTGTGVPHFRGFVLTACDQTPSIRLKAMPRMTSVWAVIEIASFAAYGVNYSQGCDPAGQERAIRAESNGAGAEWQGE
jgi:hypothetical protein